MPNFVISRVVKKNGIPFDADTLPVLRDPTGTFGMRRIDTLEIIVAAGTVIPRISTGRYELPVNGLLPGITYEYWRETVVGGSKSQTPNTITVPIAVVIPSYLTVEVGDQLAAGLQGLAAYKAATSDAKLPALSTATLRVDNAQRHQGRKADDKQALEYPRIDGRRCVDADPTTGVAIVPLNVKIATLYETDSILAGQRKRILDAQHNGLIEQEIGTAREQYVPPTNGQGVPILCLEAATLMKQYRLRSGALL